MKVEREIRNSIDIGSFSNAMGIWDSFYLNKNKKWVTNKYCQKQQVCWMNKSGKVKNKTLG
jgi:hypothetical protein